MFCDEKMALIDRSKKGESMLRNLLERLECSLALENIFPEIFKTGRLKHNLHVTHHALKWVWIDGDCIEYTLDIDSVPAVILHYTMKQHGEFSKSLKKYLAKKLEQKTFKELENGN